MPRPTAPAAAYALVALLAPHAAVAAAATPAPATPEALLKALAGTWNATMQIAAPDDSPPQVINALEVNRPGGDGGWIVSEFTSQMEGRPFEGHGLLAWNPATGKFRRVWADVTAPTPWRSEGTWDAATRTLTMWIDTFDSSGHPVRWREETLFKEDGSHVFTMYTPGPKNTEAAPITIIYRRRPEGAPPAPFRPAPASPSPEHRRLGRDVGTWNARLDTAKGSPIDPKITKAVEVNALCCDALFLVTDLDGATKKTHYAGHGLVGYDPEAKRYWSAWVDTATRDLGVTQGDWDEANATLTFPLEDHAAAAPGPTRETIAYQPDGARTLTLWARGADGREFAGVVIRYERAKEKTTPAKPTAAER
jgi:hypothetical protein